MPFTETVLIDYRIGKDFDKMPHFLKLLCKIKHIPFCSCVVMGEKLMDTEKYFQLNPPPEEINITPGIRPKISACSTTEKLIHTFQEIVPFAVNCCKTSYVIRKTR